MLYDRKIKYFTYRKGGERICSAGFAKLEVRADKCNLWIQISGLHKTDNFTRMVLLSDGSLEEPLTQIELKEGSGNLYLQLNTEKLVRNISYEQLESIVIPIAAGCELFCEVSPQKRVINKVQSEEHRISKEQVNREEVNREEVNREEVNEEKANKRNTDSVKISEKYIEINKVEEDLSDKEVVAAQNLDSVGNSTIVKKIGNIERTSNRTWRENTDVETVGAAKRQDNFTIERVDIEKNDIKPNLQPLQLLEDKWRQLSAIYPHIAPFQDERKYLRMGPQDFVVLSTKYYKLVQNSFLLHGYYNYNHVILTRLENRGEIKYYIGVPGNFYEREKQVALMFGFESFECREEPAKQGDYGYYMIRVEI